MMYPISRRSRSTETLKTSCRWKEKCDEISKCCPGRRAYPHYILPPGAGPVGAIEKILEYRPLQQLPQQQQQQQQQQESPWLPVGWSGIEIRRFAPSADGLVEYRQVLGPEVALTHHAYLGLASSASACPLMAPPVGWQDRAAAAAPAAAQGQPPPRQQQQQQRRPPRASHGRTEQENVELLQRVRRNGSFPDLVRASRDDEPSSRGGAVERRQSRDRDRRRHVQLPVDPSATYPYYSSHASRHQQTSQQHIYHAHHHHHDPRPEEQPVAPQLEPPKEFSAHRQSDLQRELQKELERELEQRRRSKSASSVIRDSAASRSRDNLFQAAAYEQPPPPHVSYGTSPSVHSKLSFQVTSAIDQPSGQGVSHQAAKTRAKSKISQPEDFQKLPSSDTLPPPYEFDGSAIRMLPQHICGLEKQPVEHHRRPRDRSRDTLRSEVGTSVDRPREKVSEAKNLQEERDFRVREEREKARLQHREQERRARRDRHEKERLDHEKRERERILKEKQERERLDQERREQERRHQEKLEFERREHERLLQIEAEKKERERRERERLEHERQVREHLERERARAEQ